MPPMPIIITRSRMLLDSVLRYAEQNKQLFISINFLLNVLFFLFPDDGTQYDRPIRRNCLFSV